MPMLKTSDLQKNCMWKRGLELLMFGLFLGLSLNTYGQPYRPNLSHTDSAFNSTNPQWYAYSNWKNGSQSDETFDSENLREQIGKFALRFLGIRYRSSGKSPSVGFDCSGFTGFVFKKFGLPIGASSTHQAVEGKKIPKNQATTGDLAFFGRKQRNGKAIVNHAALVISKPGEPLAIIHAASNKGIVITKVDESNYWKNSFLFIKQVL